MLSMDMEDGENGSGLRSPLSQASFREPAMSARLPAPRQGDSVQEGLYNLN